MSRAEEAPRRVLLPAAASIRLKAESRALEQALRCAAAALRRWQERLARGTVGRKYCGKRKPAWWRRFLANRDPRRRGAKWRRVQKRQTAGDYRDSPGGGR